MNVLVVGDELGALCESSQALDDAFGRVRASLVRQRLCEIAGSPSLGDSMALPALECTLRRDGDVERVVVRVDRGLAIIVQPYVDEMSDPPLEEAHTVLVVALEQTESMKR